jgi:hypothetical protein
VQARCAPAKQMYWQGTGTFHTIKSTNGVCPCCDVQAGGKTKPAPVHYYKAHVGDFREPAGCNDSADTG